MTLPPGTLDIAPSVADRFRMAHTDHDESEGIIPREPPPPKREPAMPVDPDAPTLPGRPSRPPLEAPQQPAAPRVADSQRPPAGRRIARKGSGPHALPDLRPEIIDHAQVSPRGRADSSPELMLLAFPRGHQVRPARPDVTHRAADR